jgi:hypothetical protein
MKSHWVTLLSGMALLAPASIPLFLTGAPSVFAPLPALTIVPAFLLYQSPLGRAVVAIPTILFFAWNPGLFRGNNKVPKRSYVLFGLFTVLDVVWFVAGWKDGLRYQGALYTYVVCALNAAPVIVLAALFLRSRSVDLSFKTNLALHWLLFAWLGWFAYPNLGELP